MNKDLEFIRGFNQINIAEICRNFGIDKSNIYKRGKYCDIIKKEIDKQVFKLYSDYSNKEE